MKEKIAAIILKLPKGLMLFVLLLGTILLDGLMYSFMNSCPACTSFPQFLTTSQALSSSILASIGTLFSLTIRQK